MAPLCGHVLNGQSERCDLMPQVLQLVILHVLCPGHKVVLPDSLRRCQNADVRFFVIVASRGKMTSRPKQGHQTGWNHVECCTPAVRSEGLTSSKAAMLASSSASHAFLCMTTSE